MNFYFVPLLIFQTSIKVILFHSFPLFSTIFLFSSNPLMKENLNTILKEWNRKIESIYFYANFIGIKKKKKKNCCASLSIYHFLLCVCVYKVLKRETGGMAQAPIVALSPIFGSSVVC